MYMYMHVIYMYIWLEAAYMYMCTNISLIIIIVSFTLPFFLQIKQLPSDSDLMSRSPEDQPISFTAGGVSQRNSKMEMVNPIYNVIHTMHIHVCTCTFVCQVISHVRVHVS